MFVIGITGGVGTGKSTVLTYLKEEYHAVIIEADKLAHQLMAKGEVAYENIVACFGEDILGDDLEIKRENMAKLVFADKDRLNQLNQIVHPAVKQAILSKIEDEKKKETKYLVIEAALLIEDGYKEICDELWFIYTDQEIRINRLKESRGYLREKSISIIKNQGSDDFFMANCDKVINNSVSFDDTKRQIDEIMQNIKG